MQSVDLVLGAIPCEWLSVRRNVGDGTQDHERAEGRSLIDAVLEIVRRIDPQWWCLEDVNQVERELPPLTPSIRLDSSHWSPQRRKRTYIGRFVRPLRAGDATTLSSCLRPGPYRIGPRAIGRTPTRSCAFSPDRIYAASIDRKAPTVCAVSSRRDAELLILQPGIEPGRQLEWQEAAMLQGFPQDYVFVGSPSDVWKMIGQAIQIDTGRAILRAIVEDWEKKGTRCKLGAHA